MQRAAHGRPPHLSVPARRTYYEPHGEDPRSPFANVDAKFGPNLHEPATPRYTSSHHAGSDKDRQSYNGPPSATSYAESRGAYTSNATSIFSDLTGSGIGPKIKRQLHPTAGLALDMAGQAYDARIGQAPRRAPLYEGRGGFTQNRSVQGSDASIRRGSFRSSARSYGGRDESSYGGSGSRYGSTRDDRSRHSYESYR
jgi:hypothetical protein